MSSTGRISKPAAVVKSAFICPATPPMISPNELKAEDRLLIDWNIVSCFTSCTFALYSSKYANTFFMLSLIFDASISSSGTGKAKITDTTDIGALRKALGSAMSRVTELFPKARNRTPVVKSYLKFAQNLLIRVKATPEELQNSINELNSIADKEDKKRDNQRKKAEQRAEQEAKDYEKTLANVSNLNATTIEQLAKKPPVYNYDTHTTENKFRPSWAEYNEQKEKWNLNPNKLANEITSIHLIKRLEEDGKDNGLVVYDDDAGNWEKHSPKTLNNFIEDCLKYPTDPLLKNKVKPEKYAQDLEKASDVKNTLTLLDGKIYGINPQTTFNYPSAHIVHLINFR